MHLVAVNISSCEVNSLREVGLRFQAKTQGQRENEGKNFFHGIVLMG